MKISGKHIAPLFFLCLALFIIPRQGYACSENLKPTETTSHSEKHPDQSCCKDNPHKKSGHHDCEEHSCMCSTITFLNIPAPGLNLKNLFSKTEKQQFGFRQALYSSDFPAIWLPPKI